MVIRLVAVEQRREPVEIVSRGRHDRRGRQQPVELRRRRIAGGLQRDVAGQHQHRHAALADGLADRDLEGARHLVGARDELAIVAAFLEQQLRVRLLKIAAADLGRWNLRGDAEHGHARAVTVEQTVDEVQVARPAAARADRELAGQVRLGAGRERGDLLVPDVHPLDLPLPADGVGQTVQAVADDTVDALDTCSGEGFRELVSHGLCHGVSPRAVSVSWRSSPPRTRPGALRPPDLSSVLPRPIRPILLGALRRGPRDRQGDVTQS